MFIIWKTKLKKTGHCGVCIFNKERSLIANLCAANKYHKKHFDTDNIQKLLHNAKIFYSAGFFLTVSPETAIAVGHHANEHNKIFAINFAAPFIIQFFKDPLSKVLESADIVFANESEALTFGQVNNLTTTDVGEIAKHVQALPKKGTKKRIVVFTQGAEKTIVANEEGKILEYHPIKIDRHLIVDTNGAGDSFVGGFLAALALGHSIEECVNAGHFAACQIIQVSGTSLHMPKPNYFKK